MIHEFSGFELDEGLFELKLGVRVVQADPKVLDLLTHLVRNRGRVVTKDELFETLWPGVLV